jgi:hypothetical protein
MRKGKTFGRFGGVKGLGDEAEDQIAQMDAAADAQAKAYVAAGDKPAADFEREGDAAYDAHTAAVESYGRPITAAPTAAPVLRPVYSNAATTVEAPAITKGEAAQLKALSKQVETKITNLIADNGSLMAAGKVMAAKEAVADAKAAKDAAVVNLANARVATDAKKATIGVAALAVAALALYLVMRK